MTTELDDVYTKVCGSDKDYDVVDEVFKVLGIDPDAPAGTCKSILDSAKNIRKAIDTSTSKIATVLKTSMQELRDPRDY